MTDQDHSGRECGWPARSEQASAADLRGHAGDASRMATPIPTPSLRLWARLHTD